METRLAHAADAPVLTALHVESFGNASWSLEQIAGSLALPTTRVWIAEDHGAAQGFLFCQFASGEVDILTFCVTKAARRQGIGRLLLQTAIATAQRENMQRIFLEVAADNHAALTLYAAARFTPNGTRRAYYPRPDGAVDGVMLIRILETKAT